MTTLILPDVDRFWTVADLDALPHELRGEIHNGRLVIAPPPRLWHQHTQRRICDVLRWGGPRRSGRFAVTRVGVVRTPFDARVCDVGAFAAEPPDAQAAWYEPTTLELVVEVWSPPLDPNLMWYAQRGIPGYWLAEPIAGEQWDALVTMYDIARSASGRSTYVETGRTTLSQLERTASHEASSRRVS